jgi:hypothetical protein
MLHDAASFPYIYGGDSEAIDDRDRSELVVVR